jgi:predicted Zn-dependent peptidase
MKADPGYLADTCFAAVVFGDHPYGKPHGGTEESIGTIKRIDLQNFHANFYVPENSFIVFAGDATPKEAERYIGKYFSKWKGSPSESPRRSDGTGKGFFVPPVSTGNRKRRVVVVDKPAAVQSAVRIGGIGISRSNPDYIKAVVMNTLLGGYFSSRINQNLREVHGYTYGGRTTFDARALPGPFEVSADVRNEVTSETVSEILRELNKLCSTMPTKEELTMVKNYLIGLFPIQLESPQQVASRVIAIELYHLPKSYYNRYRENISKVTPRDIRVTAKKYIRAERFCIVLSGNSNEIKDKLDQFGKVEILDAEGNRIGK